MTITKKMFFAILGIQLLLPYIHGYKILYMVPIHGKSHWVYAENFIEALLNKGHEVTCITNFEYRGKPHQNYTDVMIEDPFNFASMANSKNYFTRMIQNPLATSLILPFFMSSASDHMLSDKNIQRFIHEENVKFDLIVNHEMFLDSFLMFAHKFNAPIVSISPFGVADAYDHSMGVLTPIAHVPNVFLPYSDEMTFSQRWYNTIIALFDGAMRKIAHIPLQNRLAQKHFGHLGALPTVGELLRSRSLIFINMHRAFVPPRPSMNLVYIGGAHVKEPKPLPQDLQSFIDESEHGVIYFSFGTVVDELFFNSTKLPIFLDVLGKLKQRVIWKCNNESIVVPSNVLVRKWLPQIDILAHPKTRLFISHGGLFSNIESMKFGVPMLVVPFFGDQLRNAKRIESAGYGIYKELDDIEEDNLLEALNSLISHESYSQKAQEISRILNDNIIHPMDEFIWWSEYVIRTNGAKHLKSYAAEMSLITYLLVDVFAATIVLVVVAILALRFVFKKMLTKRTVSAKNKKE